MSSNTEKLTLLDNLYYSMFAQIEVKFNFWHREKLTWRQKIDIDKLGIESFWENIGESELELLDFESFKRCRTPPNFENLDGFGREGSLMKNRVHLFGMLMSHQVLN